MNNEPEIHTMTDPTPAPVLHYSDGGADLWHGDCIETMRLLEPESVDAVITDPPYALEFMNRSWDTFKTEDRVKLRGFEVWCEQWAAEALRVLKPGGFLLAFGSARTAHRLTSGIENAGFEIRDGIAWLYSSGFPKNLDVSKALDKQRHNRAELLQFTEWARAARDAAGITNPAIDRAFGFAGMAGHWTTDGQQPAVPTLEQVPQLLELFGLTLAEVPDEIRSLIVELNGQKGQPGAAWLDREVTGQHTKIAHAAGWRAKFSEKGETAAPAAERRDLAATELSRKWQGWGTALKPSFEPIVLARKPLVGTVATNITVHGVGAINVEANRTPSADPLTPEDARWPANALLTHAPTIDTDTGEAIGDACGNGCVDGCPVLLLEEQRRDAARFFPAFRYEAKAPTSERPTVIDEQGNTLQHPTVKPLDLMRHLVRLFVPAGGTVLEPFAGSGTTLEACLIEGVSVIGIELDGAHLPLIEKRLKKEHQQTLFGDL